MDSSAWNARFSFFLREIGEALYGLFMTSVLIVFFIGFPAVFLIKLGWLAGGALTIAWYFSIWFIKKYYPSGWL